jgi:zinc transport system substrate-binding protein
VGACAVDPGSGAGTDQVRIVAGFYPFQFLAEQVAGDRATVTGLAAPGAEPHDLELTARQVATIAEADLVLYLSGFQPAVDAAVSEQARGDTLDVATVVELSALSAGAHLHDGEQGDHEAETGGDPDPHVWLDPVRFGTVADALAERLGAIDTAHADAYAARAAQLRRGLADLDEQYAQALAPCLRREIVVSHAAFGYLAQRYDLEQIAVAGLTPDTEPTPARLAEVIEEARAHGATTVFFETLVSSQVAEVIADEVGVGTAVLDPIEGLSAGGTGDYFSLMRENLVTLTSALECA